MLLYSSQVSPAVARVSTWQHPQMDPKPNSYKRNCLTHSRVKTNSLGESETSTRRGTGLDIMHVRTPLQNADTNFGPVKPCKNLYDNTLRFSSENIGKYVNNDSSPL